MSKFRVPWRTILAVYGGLLLVANLSSIVLKTFFMRDVAVDAASEAFLRDKFVMNVGVCLFGAALLVLGLVLAIRKSRSRRASGPGDEPARKVDT